MRSILVRCSEGKAISEGLNIKFGGQGLWLGQFYTNVPKQSCEAVCVRLLGACCPKVAVLRDAARARIHFPASEPPKVAASITPDSKIPIPWREGWSKLSFGNTRVSLLTSEEALSSALV